jgi:hypothetical protein
VFFPIRERFNHTARYGSSSWTNGLLDKLALPDLGAIESSLACYGSSSWANGLLHKFVLPNMGGGVILQPTMSPAAGPMACWASLFFPVGTRFNPPAHYGSSSWANGLLDKLVLPNWERFNPPAHYGPSSWTNGLLDKLVLPNKSGLVLQPTMGPAAGPMVCWTSLFFPKGERFNPPAHYGSSSWTNGLLCKLVLPNRGTV